MYYGLFEPELLIFEFANAVVCIVLILVALNKSDISPAVKSVLCISCFLPYFLNGVLFSPELMSDQFQYLDAVVSIRDFVNINSITEQWNHRITNASYLFALLPLPVVESVRSLGFFSKFIYLCIFIFLYYKGVFTRNSMLFFLLFPSLVLYSSLGLRDTQILLFMVFSTYFMVSGRFSFALIFAIPLLFLKFQNFYIQIILIFIYWLLNVRNAGIDFKKAFATISLLYIAVIILYPFFIEEINFYRVAMHIEDGGSPGEIDRISSYREFIMFGFVDGLGFIVRPFIWEAVGALQIIQAIENMFLLMFLVFHIVKCARIDFTKIGFWLVYLMFFATIYGLVVSNFGTTARYKFPIVVVFVIFSSLEYKVTGRKGRRTKTNANGI